MSIIIAQQGDTFDLLSRRAYGTEGGAAQLRGANPGIQEPIPEGTRLLVTPRLGAPRNRSAMAPTNNPDEVVLRVAEERFRFWDSVTLRRAIDSTSSITVDAVWEPQNAPLRRVFRPFSYLDTDIHVGSERLFTGVMLSPQPLSSADASTVSASGYGRTGVLSDCTAPASAYPIEFTNQSLESIAASLLEPFGIEVAFDVDAGLPFERVSLAPSQKILPFLAGLAQQRNAVIGETPEGAAWFRQSAESGEPVATLTEGQAPVISASPSFNAQSVYSHVTGITPTRLSADGDQLTVRNPHLETQLRPFVFQSSDNVPGGLEAAVQAKTSRMFANMVSWVVEVPSWRNALGGIWTPNTFVNLTAPRAMVYQPFNLLVRAVTLQASPSARTATLELVLPGAFAGELPETLPWDE